MKKNPKKLLVGLVYDLKSEYLKAGFSAEEVAEFDTDDTIESLEKTIRSLGYDVERIGNAKTLCAGLVSGKKWDLVFNFAEGLKGRARESQVPCILELYDIPYTMSDPLINAVSLDKAMTKKIVQSAGLNTPKFHVVRTRSDIAMVKLDYPLFAKPIAEGTGKGIRDDSMIEDENKLEQVCVRLLKQFDGQPVLVEEYLPGREFTTGIIGTGSAARVVGTLEVKIRPNAGTKIYSYETKKNYEELVDYALLTELRLKKKVEELAIRAYSVLEVRDCGRIDIRLDAKGAPSFMEINTIPGLNPVFSDLPILAKHVGMSYKELIGAIIESALTRARK